MRPNVYISSHAPKEVLLVARLLGAKDPGISRVAQISNATENQVAALVGIADKILGYRYHRKNARDGFPQYYHFPASATKLEMLNMEEKASG